MSPVGQNMGDGVGALYDHEIRYQAMRDAAPEMFDTLEKLRGDLAEEDAELHAQRIAVIDLTLAQAKGGPDDTQ